MTGQQALLPAMANYKLQLTALFGVTHDTINKNNWG
jgi:hypothetical protein